MKTYASRRHHSRRRRSEAPLHRPALVFRSPRRRAGGLLALGHSPLADENRHVPRARYRGKQRPSMCGKEAQHSVASRDERAGHPLGGHVHRSKDEDSCLRLLPCCDLCRVVPDPLVPGQDHPPPLCNGGDPLVVRAVRGEVVVMQLDREPGRLQRPRCLL